MSSCARAPGERLTMYETRFGLRRRPFRATPDSAFYYPATGHERALAQLAQSLADDEGLALLLGDPGTGKTLLGQCLLDRLGDAVTAAFLSHSHFPDRAGLLQAILFDLGLPYAGKGEQELRLALTEFLLTNYAAGNRTVLVLDEAQRLSVDLLEELRLLGNLEGREGKALQVVLLALPELAETLPRPELAAFNQRLAVRARLEPLGLHEAADYIVHQLRAAGGRPESIITDEALEVLARGTQGLPRLLNRAMHQSLTLACTAEADLVDAEVALEALGAIGLSESDDPSTAEGRLTSAGEMHQAPQPHEPAETETEGDGVLHLANEEQGEDRTDPQPPRDPGRMRRLFASPRRTA